ncbi:hypothetical protein PR202_ga08877 [Eleusine coracana subsp. coracana]|uniref:FCP1 homology domain-containing protein n=1 Tax=Eleusine coracana subsp. coracana TaxID=191504 RepID=A0AAV5C3V4_ELECO|nr:hypothetical protein PR202_ga08877 [Eleusine coracana subsp. coracana]
MADAASSSSAPVPAQGAAALGAVAEAAPPEEMTLVVKWRGQEQSVRMVGDDTLGELKLRICEVTGVLPMRQTLLYPKVMFKDLPDSTLLSAIPFKPNGKITMVGCTCALLQPSKGNALLSFGGHWIKLLNPCRKGKKLLVLDIDYTLFDHRSPAENPQELMRPYLHEFLTAAYAAYDIMIWSATGMKWVELKMGQLGVLTNPQYKITALLDHLAMITVQSETHSKKKTFDCKPLGVIWAQFPEYYNEKNTIMFDDLRRNFVMNPQNGLVIKPFREARLNRDTDQELPKLTQYLLSISELEDLSELDHNKWESFTEESAKRRRRREPIAARTALINMAVIVKGGTVLLYTSTARGETQTWLRPCMAEQESHHKPFMKPRL